MALAKVHLASSALGMCISCNVILPQRKDAAQNHPLPVLWLLHGAYGNYTDWIRKSNIERYAAPYGLAVVMPDAQNSCYTDMAHGRKYYSCIAEELPVALRKYFHFSNKREDNFIAGLSMGGRGSLMIGLSKPEKYAAIGCLSAGAFHQGKSPMRDLAFGRGKLENTYKDPFGSAKKILEKDLPCPRIYHACGTEDFLLSDARNTRDFFDALPGNPFSYEYHEDPGDHTWDFWDEHIKEFIQFLNLPKVNNEYI